MDQSSGEAQGLLYNPKSVTFRPGGNTGRDVWCEQGHSNTHYADTQHTPRSQNHWCLWTGARSWPPPDHYAK